MRGRRQRIGAFAGFLLGLSVWPGAAAQDRTYALRYIIEPQPERHSAVVTVEIEDARLLRELDFNIDPAVHGEFAANGSLTIEDGRARWRPPDRNARLSLRARIDHERDPGEFDALITDDWAIFRGDDVVPPVRVRSLRGAAARATLEFRLPEGWEHVNTGWTRLRGLRFRIDDPERRFDRPTGWMIAGRIGTRRERLGPTRLAVSAPAGAGFRRMDVLAFLTFVWPEMERAFRKLPQRLLIVGAGDPMWRGGLSAPNSFYLHAERPLLSENGTSPLLHELVHLVTGIRGSEGHDWIAEGIAEYYAIELLHRAGGLTEQRRAEVLRGQAQWGREAETLFLAESSGAVTARAVALFDRLDRELRACSGGAHSLDDLLQAIEPPGEVDLDDLRRAGQRLLGREPGSLQDIGSDRVDRTVPDC